MAGDDTIWETRGGVGIMGARGSRLEIQEFHDFWSAMRPFAVLSSVCGCRALNSTVGRVFSAITNHPWRRAMRHLNGLFGVLCSASACAAQVPEGFEIIDIFRRSGFHRQVAINTAKVEG